MIREDRGITGTFGTIAINITYEDGTTTCAETTISYLNGRWSFGSAELDESILSHNRKKALEEFANREVVLSKEYSRVGKSSVLLRIPEELVWDPKELAYDHPKYQIRIQLEPRHGESHSSLVSFVEKKWTSQTRILERREDLSKEKVKAILFDGDVISEQSRAWRCMYLVIGDEHQATLISTVFPNLPNYRRAVRECLTTARCEPNIAE